MANRFKFWQPPDDDFDNSALAKRPGDMGTLYPTHFQLRQRPFPATPDPARYYPATSHERALARLLGGLEEGEGVLTLLGAPGTGKTLLCHCLLERLSSAGPARQQEKALNITFLTNGHIGSRTGLFQAILYDLSLPYEGRSEQELRLALTDHLLRGYAEKRSTLLILDEAQHLTPDLLEELRLLGNLEAHGSKALQILLVGQPALLETLRRPELTALWQRVAVRTEIEPLPLQEAADYLLHHVRMAGARPERLFLDEALELLCQQTRGVPRLLNQAANQALRLAAEAGAAQVDVEAVLEALALLGLTEDETNANQNEAEAGADSASLAEEKVSCRLLLGSEYAG